MKRDQHAKSHSHASILWRWSLILVASVTVGGSTWWFLFRDPPGQEQPTVRVGILHSLTGAMANSETPLKDLLLHEIELLNARGGVLGHQVEAVVENPDSSWDLYRAKAQKLIAQDDVVAVFGGWTTASRRAALPVFEQRNRLLFYPTVYEGEEQSPNIFYFGAAPNQQALPALQYLYETKGGQNAQWIFVGADSIYRNTTERVLTSWLLEQGVSESHLHSIYQDFETEDYTSVIQEIADAMRLGPTIVVSTVTGDANFYFFRALSRQHWDLRHLTILALAVGEEEVRGYPLTNLPPIYAAWSYFMSLDNPENRRWKQEWQRYVRRESLQGSDSPLTHDPMLASRTALRMWGAAVEQAGSFDTDLVREAMIGQKQQTPSGFEEVMGENHHLARPLFIGRLQEDGQFDIVWSSEEILPADPWHHGMPSTESPRAVTPAEKEEGIPQTADLSHEGVS